MADPNTLPDWLLVLRKPLPGETAGKHIGRIVRALIGLSLKNHADMLAELFLVNEKPGRAKAVSGVKTNCGTSMREVWCLAECPDNFVVRGYENGMAVTWDLQAARDMGMLFGAHDTVYKVVKQDGSAFETIFRSKQAALDFAKSQNLPDNPVDSYVAWELIDEGWGLHYAILGTNDDHMEFALGKPNLITGMCEHAGGGREDNAITRSVGDIRFSLGRPLQHIIAPYKMASSDAAVQPTESSTSVPVGVPVASPDTEATLPASPGPARPMAHAAGGLTIVWTAAIWSKHPMMLVLAIGATVAMLGLLGWLFWKRFHKP